ncbi:MAG: hypothetical protein JXA03_16585 [Bacteroidales bacterium]|nr:hypothetical protein [Bacteroidales bacterium]
MKKILASMAILLTASLTFAQSGTFSNITSSQRSDGSGIVDIYYDLSGTEPSYSVYSEVTFDGGSNYLLLTGVSGDAGDNIAPGTGKHIVWNFGAEYANQHNDMTQIRLTGSFPEAWNCGQPLMVEHSAGIVAPVNKTVSYGTASTNLSGQEKCWITQNLGAGQQASSPSDNTEAAAGWYWQFNRKQGYSHDGSVRTPSSSWNDNITENAGWAPGQDPCRVLLGNDWRIPTKSEWENVDNNGGWDDYYDSYNSVLKLHAAGYLDASNGSNLYYRGVLGHYWSANQESNSDGYYMYIKDSSSHTDHGNKAYGYSVRCIKD